jgi:replicative DNA helicase
MQAVIDALRLTPELRAVVVNVEMPATVLLDRQLSRLSGIDLHSIRHRLFTAEHSERLEAGLATLEELIDRLCFCLPPFSLDNIAATVDEFGAELVVIDYIQRIAPPGEHVDKKGSIDAMMNYLRLFADAGCAVLALAAIGRTKDRQGRSSYANEGLNLASFRESSELEFGADNAYILMPDATEPSTITLKCFKARHGEVKDIVTTFDAPRQSFSPKAIGEEWNPKGSNLRAKIAALWGTTESNSSDEGEPL